MVRESPQLTPPRFADQTAAEPCAQHVKLGLGHRALEPEHEAAHGGINHGLMHVPDINALPFPNVTLLVPFSTS